MTFVRVTLFSIAVLLVYTLFANIVPQVESEPPLEEEIEPGALDRAGQIAWGQRLFSGKGTCTLCHNNLGRAPDLLAMDLATALPERLSDPRNAGASAGLEGAEAIGSYLLESLVDPSAYVVAGYGKKGTGDTVSPMPRVDAAPISLTATEVDAVIAFLQELAGVEPTVPLPAEAAAPGLEVAEGEVAPEEPEPMAGTAEDAVEKFGCSACHDMFGSEADIGPRLDGIGERMDETAIRRAILDPNAELAQGFDPDFMPQDYGEQMRAAELELLIDYLATLPATEAAE